MSGTIVSRKLKSGKVKWYARVRENGKDTYGPARETKTDAKRDLACLIPDETKKRYIPTLQEFYYTVLDGPFGKMLAPNTHYQYESVRRTHVNGTKLGAKRLDRINQDDVDQWVSELKLQPSSVRATWAKVRAILNMASDKYQINPKALKPKLPRMLSKPRPILSSAQVKDILTNVNTDADRRFLIMFLTGIRRHEALTMKKSDIDRDRKQIWIESTKTDSSRGWVKVNDLVIELFDALPGDYLFSKNGHRIYHKDYYRQFNEWRKAHSIPEGITGHRLRASIICHMLDTGQNPKLVQRHARHSKISMTMDTYAQACAYDEADPTAQMIEMIGGKR